LARFDRRPALGQLPLTLQRDIKAFFQSYAQACKRADALLFSVGKTEQVNAACSESPIGKKMPEALYVHISAIDQLSASLRVFEGCARAYIGRVERYGIGRITTCLPGTLSR
jgi:DNA phosphorothioation-associated putative methyltransferase